MLGYVEAYSLVLRVHAQAQERVYHPQQREGPAEGDGYADSRAEELE